MFTSSVLLAASFRSASIFFRCCRNVSSWSFLACHSWLVARFSCFSFAFSCTFSSANSCLLSMSYCLVLAYNDSFSCSRCFISSINCVRRRSISNAAWTVHNASISVFILSYRTCNGKYDMMLSLLSCAFTGFSFGFRRTILSGLV